MGELAVDASGLLRRVGDRRHLVKGGARARGERQDRLLRVAIVVGEILRRRPVVDHLVIVPLEERRHFGVERAHVLVEKVVLPAAAVLVEALGDLLDALGDEVVPGAAVGELDPRGDRPVRVDRVAAVDEEVGRVRAHRLVGAHAAPLDVDAPALPGRVARPGETHRASPERGGAEVADDRLRHRSRVGEAREAHAVEDLLIACQSAEQALDGEVAARHGVDRRQRDRALERRRRRDLDQHPRRAIRTRPDHAALARHVAGLHAVRDRGPRVRAGDHREGERARAERQRGGGRETGTPREESAARRRGRSVGCAGGAFWTAHRVILDRLGAGCAGPGAPVPRAVSARAVSRR